MQVRILLAVSCLPSLVLLYYVYKKDRTEKEPFKLLLTLFILGAASCLPAALLETLTENVFLSIFHSESSLSYLVAENFLNVALFEELGKFLILYFVTHKNKNFNSLFDGLVYAVFTALGFATLENILYVAQYGLSTGLLRAVTAIPGHMFDGVIMGQFYTLWHLSKNISITERNYASMGFIDRIVEPESMYRLYFPLALIVPIVTHGLYDFLASYESTLSFIVFILYLIGLYIYCFGKINKLSKADRHETNLIAAELNRKYPYLYPRIRQVMAQQAAMQYNPFTQRSYTPYAAPQQPSYPPNRGQW